MTRVVLIEAGPTKWDAEDRLVGHQSLPLTPGAAAVITAAVDQLEHPIQAVYRAASNEAADQAARSQQVGRQEIDSEEVAEPPRAAGRSPCPIRLAARPACLGV